MDKLKLQIDELVVESFNTAGADPPEGTVFAHSAAPCDTWDDHTCPWAQTCNGRSPTCDGGYTCVEEKKWYFDDATGPNESSYCTVNFCG